jgi:hypothetical protein
MSHFMPKKGLVRAQGIWRDILFRGLALSTIVISAINFSESAEQKPSSCAQEPSAETSSGQAEWQLVRYTELLDALTAVLAVSTLGLWIVTLRGMQRQVQDTKRSLSISSEAADAAKASAEAATLNAQAAIRSELPIVSPSRIALFESDKLHSPRIVGYPPNETVFEVDFKNRGRSPAELIEICLEWHVSDKLPDVPEYNTVSPYPPGQFIDVNNGIPGGPVKIKIRLQEDEVSDLPHETVFLWVYGFVTFRDTIVGEQHTSRFCAKWQSFVTDRDGTRHPLGFVYDSATPPEYTKKT